MWPFLSPVKVPKGNFPGWYQNRLLIPVYPWITLIVVLRLLENARTIFRRASPAVDCGIWRCDALSPHEASKLFPEGGLRPLRGLRRRSVAPSTSRKVTTIAVKKGNAPRGAGGGRLNASPIVMYHYSSTLGEVVDVLNLTHRQNPVRGHRRGSDNSGVEQHAGEKNKTRIMHKITEANRTPQATK